MILLRALLCLFALAELSPAAAAVTFVPHLRENEPHVVESEEFLFLGHSTAFWDGHKTGPAVRTALAFANGKKLFKVGVVSDVMLSGDVAAMHYFAPEEVDLIVPSRAGQHRLQLPRAKRIYVLGGNLGRCLCEGIRDLARGWYLASKEAELEIVLVRDGIYDNHPRFGRMAKGEATGYVERFLLPSFACPLQNWFDVPRLPMPDTKLSLWFEGEQLKEFPLEGSQANPAALTRTIRIHFKNSESL